MIGSRSRELILKTYRKSPLFFQRFCWRIYGLVHKLRINIWIISGKDSLEIPLSIIYAGSEKHKNYIASLAFNSSYSEIHIGRTWLWNLISIIMKRSHDCSLLVLETKVKKTFCRLYKDQKSFFIPSWVNGEVDISADISLLTKKEKLNSDVRKIRKNNLQFEVTNDECQFENFYNSMYLPYINKAHGNQTILMSYEDMISNMSLCDLLLIKKDNEYIGGCLLIYEKNVPRIWSIGVKDANVDYLKAGVLSSLYYFAIKYLKQKGYKKVNFGLSRAFLKDGVLQYKKKWGLQIDNIIKTGFLIKPLSKTVGGKGFFLNNPFIYIDNMRFNGAIFVEAFQSLSKNDIEKIYKKYYMTGISKLFIYQFRKDDSGMVEICSSRVI